MEKPGITSQVQLVQKEFSRAKAYASEYQGDTPQAHFFNTRLRRVCELLSDFQTGRLLDVGCGPAMIGHMFQGRPVQYHGVDISEDMLGECRKTFGDDSRFHFSLGRMEELKFQDAYFDVVLCLGAFEYAPEGQVALREIARVTNGNGTVIITMHNPFSPYRVWFRYGYTKLGNALAKLRRLMAGKTHTQEVRGPERPVFKVYSEQALRNMLASEGLEIEDVVYYDFRIFPAPLDALFPNASVYVSRKLEFLCRSKLKRLGTGFIIKGRKKALRQV